MTTAWNYSPLDTSEQGKLNFPPCSTVYHKLTSSFNAPTPALNSQAWPKNIEVSGGCFCCLCVREHPPPQALLSVFLCLCTLHSLLPQLDFQDHTVQVSAYHRTCRGMGSSWPALALQWVSCRSGIPKPKTLLKRERHRFPAFWLRSSEETETERGTESPTVLRTIKSGIYPLNLFLTQRVSTPLECVDYYDGEKRINKRGPS